MPCPVCKSGIMYAVKLDIEYIDEPITFSSGGFDHVHDPNFRVGTWRCENNHEYELRGLRPCIACVLEKQAAIKEEQRLLANSNRRQNVIGDDHHYNNAWNNFQPGPII